MSDFANSTAVFDTANWMRNSLSILGDKRLDEICIPGSHDAGMSEFNIKINYGGRNNTLTQTFGIGTQLELGARYFDIRPVLHKGNPNVFYCGHTSMVLGIYCGALGQPITDVIEQINNFIQNRQELILIDLSHFEVDDNGQRKPYSANNWKSLIDLLDGINNKLTIYDAPFKKSVTSNKLSDLLRDGSKVLIFISGGSSDFPAEPLPNYIFYNDEYGSTDADLQSKLRKKNDNGNPDDIPDVNKRNHYDNRLSIYNKYADANTVMEMSKDQFTKLKNYSFGKYFLISWTLTQSAGQAFMGNPTIIELARKADEHAGLLLRSGIINKDIFPNVFFVDNIVNNRPALISLQAASIFDNVCVRLSHIGQPFLSLAAY